LSGGHWRGAKEALLAIDIGTSTTKAVVIAPDGERLAAAAVRTPILQAADHATVDALQLLRDVVGLARQVAGECPSIIGCGVTAQLGLVLVDANLRPVADALLWADRRARVQREQIVAAAGPDLLRRTGRRAESEHLAPRLLWFKQRDPVAFRRARWALSLKDFIVAHLTGSVATDDTHASYSLLFDVRDREWSHELLVACGLDADLLPEPCAAGAAQGGIRPSVAQALGVQTGTPVSVGGPDGTVGALAAGATIAGATVDIAGTTDVVLHTVAQPPRDLDPRVVLNAHLVPGLWTMGGPTGVTGGAIEWFSQALGYTSVAAALEASQHVQVGVGSPRINTEMTGSRFPDWNDNMRGSVTGISLGHTSADLIAAAEQGAGFIVRRGLEALQESGCKIDRVVVVGSVARVPGAVQRRADLWRLPVVTLSDEQATLTGAAILAACAAGLFATVHDAAAAMSKPGEEHTPAESNRATIEEAFAAWTLQRVCALTVAHATDATFA
jgi:xylulokinase